MFKKALFAFNPGVMMRVYKSKGKVIFVASGSGGSGCPTMAVTESVARFRDDYKGRIRLPKSIAKAIF